MRRTDGTTLKRVGKFINEIYSPIRCAFKKFFYFLSFFLVYISLILFFISLIAYIAYSCVPWLLL